MGTGRQEVEVALRRRRDERGHELFAGFSEVQEIGVGSLATVYRAREIGTSRLVALKLLNVRDASPRAIESFERESLALGALSSHPNIVTLYRTFRTPDGRPVLVLELCSGAVADRLHGGAGLQVQDAVAIGIKVAGALETAHRGGILHRDVKPQNILVTEFGEPALADFGVAMLQSSTQTTAGLFDFTTLHAAPELLEGQGTSAATDVYELASSLYQLIAGQSAFRAYEGEAPASVILRILRDSVRPLSGAHVPVQLSDLLIRAMDKDKENRPPTAAEFAAELAEVEKAQGWPRTQFLIRDAAGAGLGSGVTRLPDDVPRGLPSTLGAMPPAIAQTPVPLAPEPEPVPEPKLEPEPEPEPEPVPVTSAAGRAMPAAAAPVAPAAAAPPASPPVAPPVAPPASPPAAWAPPPPPATPPPAAWDEAVRETAAETAGRWTPPPAPAAEAVPEPAIEAVPEPAIEAVPEPAIETVVEPAGDIALQPEFQLPQPPEPEPEPEPVLVAEEPAEPQAEVEPRAAADDPPPVPSGPPPLQGPPPNAPPPAPETPLPLDTPPPLDEPESRWEPSAPAVVSWWAPLRSGEASADEYPIAPERPGDHADPTGHPNPAYPPQSAVAGWSNRISPDPAQSTGDLVLDPASLRPKLTVRAGTARLTADGEQLTLRSALRKQRLPWSQVQRFEQHFPDTDGPGVLVAITPTGAVELPATRRVLGELRNLHALLEAYRLRALARAANR